MNRTRFQFESPTCCTAIMASVLAFCAASWIAIPATAAQCGDYVRRNPATATASTPSHSSTANRFLHASLPAHDQEGPSCGNAPTPLAPLPSSPTVVNQFDKWFLAASCLQSVPRDSQRIAFEEVFMQLDVYSEVPSPPPKTVG